MGPRGLAATRALALLCLGATSGVWADATLIFEEGDGLGRQTLKEPMYISGGKIRLGNREAEGEYVVFDARARTMTVVDQREKSFMKMDERAFDEMSAALLEATEYVLARLEERLKDLPAEERVQVRSELQGSVPALARDERTASGVRRVATGKRLDVNGFRCEVIEMHRDFGKSSQLCVVSREDLGMDSEDYATLRNFQAFMAEVAAKLPASTGIGFDLGDPKREHIPVQIIAPDPQNQGAATVTRLAKVSPAPIDGSVFQIPDGFRRKDFRSLLQQP